MLKNLLDKVDINEKSFKESASVRMERADPFISMCRYFIKRDNIILVRV